MTKKKNQSLRAKDPYLSREQAKYTHPLPSREWIIQLLEHAGIPQSIPSLAKQLTIQPSEYEFFEHRLKAMARDGQILINRRGLVCIANKLAILKCRVIAHKDGFGFATPLNQTNHEEDFVLYERQMRGVMHGDIVTVRPLGLDKRGRQEGQVLDIIERAQSKVIGRFHLERGVALLIPEDTRLQSILLEPNSVQHLNVELGQVIVGEIESYPNQHRPAVAKLIEVLGDYADSGMEIEIALRKHQLPHQFSQACEKESSRIANTVRPSERKNRIDLRNLPLVTIDGEHSRDFDDAVYAEKVGRHYRLIVAIADVAHYVKPQSALDQDAKERATSVYFPRRVIPMLPEKLSNGICSLNPEVERLCMVCDMTITYAGNIQSYQFYPATIKSHARLTYQQVWDWLQHGSQSPLLPHIQTLYKLYQILHKKRQKRGAIEFDSTETQMIFNDDGKIERIEPIIRNDAHKLIEECMLAANVCAADFLLTHKQHSLFRNHAGPTPEKLTALREQLALLGLQLKGGEKPTPKDYAHLADQINERSDKELIQTMLLRSMQQAVYEDHNSGHFGLAYPHYTHFTSPIRRYPDLLVHRSIKAILSGSPYETNWKEIANHSSFCERRADEAARDVENWLKTYYMQDKIGEIFTGKITHMTNFGIFVTLDNIHIEGMIHISDLGKDYFNYHSELLAMIGERSGKRFNMGDSLTIQVARADLENSKIDFILAPNAQSKHTQSKPSKTPKKKKQPQATQPQTAQPKSLKIPPKKHRKIQTTRYIKTASGKILTTHNPKSKKKNTQKKKKP